MKLQWSLRTLLIVMTLGAPTLAGVIRAVPEVIRSLSPKEEEWAEAIRAAQQVQALSGGFQTSDKRKLQSNGDCLHENSLQVDSEASD